MNAAAALPRPVLPQRAGAALRPARIDRAGGCAFHPPVLHVVSMAARDASTTASGLGLPAKQAF
jgi:hypothetical protein